MTSDELDKRLQRYYGATQFEQAPTRYGGADCPPAWRFVDAKIHLWTPAEREHIESGCRFCEKTQRMLAAAEVGGAVGELAPRPQPTTECPSPPRVSEALKNGWSPLERRHVSGCEYCQELVLDHWRLNAPGVGHLVEFVAGVLPDRKAMELYLDENSTYARLRSSTIIKSLARILREITGLAAPDEELGPIGHLRAFLLIHSGPALGLTRGSAAQSEAANERPLRQVADFANSMLVSSAFEANTRKRFSTSSTDGRVMIVAAIEDGRLSVEVASSYPQDSGRRLLIEILAERGDSTLIEITLEEDTRTKRVAGRASHRPHFGWDLSKSSVLASWVS